MLTWAVNSCRVIGTGRLVCAGSATVVLSDHEVNRQDACGVIDRNANPEVAIPGLFRALEFASQRGFGMIVAADERGPRASHVPFVLDQRDGRAIVQIHFTARNPLVPLNLKDTGDRRIAFSAMLKSNVGRLPVRCADCWPV